MDPEKTTPVTDAEPEWRDPFCEPQTIPVGWNVSEMLLVPSTQSEEKPAYQMED